ncbi:hypothetical protein LCGC14_2495290, partial [marine sediment metagenome]
MDAPQQAVRNNGFARGAIDSLVS